MIGAAVVDDVIGLVILTVVVKFVAGDGITAATVGSTLVWAVGFLVLSESSGC